MKKNRLERITGLPQFVLNIIFIVIGLGALFGWGKSLGKKAENKLQVCSKYTIGTITELRKRTFKNSNLVYVYHYNREKIEYADRPNPKGFNDWLKRDDDYWQTNWVGRRIWIKIYCDDPKLHRVLWDTEVPDTVRYIPEKGWDSLPPYISKTDE